MRIEFTRIVLTGLAFACWAVTTAWAVDDAVLKRIDERFQPAEVAETPHFQRHVVPLFGRLGCNARSCHGSFQGRGGFQLSLFGYDFKTDYEALFDEKSPRVDKQNPLSSLIIAKPTDDDNHEGGQRYEKSSWQYNVIRRWIESGANFDAAQIASLSRLEVWPSEILFSKTGEQVQLQAIAVWADGTHEDVTPLCRFQTNDDQICNIDVNGLVTSSEPGDTHVVVFYDNGVTPIPVIRPVSDRFGENYPQVATNSKVDELVVHKLKKLGVVPSQLCTDAEFLRRVKLDLTGTLPTAGEVEGFVADNSHDKRSRKIDELLNSPAYAAWWTTKLCDFTGNNDQQLGNILPPMNQSKSSAAAKAWYDWIYKRVAENVPYDQLVEGLVTAKSMEPGDSYREYCEEMCAIYRGDEGKSFADLPSMPFYWARRDFRQIEPRAIGFAYAFLGIRIQCAQCHKHPFDQWSKDDFAQFTRFFSTTSVTNNQPPGRFKEEYNQILADLNLGKDMKGNQLGKMMPAMLQQGKVIPFNVVYVNDAVFQQQNDNDKKNKGDKKNKNPQPAKTAKLLGADVVSLTENADVREPLMQWLRSETNPYFTRAFVNRVWAAYFHRGIVEPPDDLSLANPPANAPLLDHLASGFYQSGFDMKWVHRTILNSETYQRSWQPNETNVGDEKNFSHAIQRRLPAEVIVDALVQATANDTVVEKMQKDVSGRAIAIPGSNGQAANGGKTGFALTVFGRSTRESNCDCDRAMDPSLLQTVFLQNDQLILNLLNAQDGWLNQLARLYKKPQQNVARDENQNKQKKNYAKQLANFAKEIEKMKSRNAPAEKIQAAETRLAAFKKKMQDQAELPASLDKQTQTGVAQSIPAQNDSGPADAAQPNAEQPSATPVFDAKQLINQAYLRTVSRPPSERELARCERYIANENDEITGLRQVLWALINTKEFIVNH